MQENFDIARSLGNIEGKLDTMLDTFKAHVEQDHKDFAAIHSRIGRLEKWQTKVIAYGTVAGAAIGILVKVLLK